jgi:hypothetical protein
MVFVRNEVARDWARPMTSLVMIWAFSALTLGLIGPFGTLAALPLGWRLLFWGGVLAAGVTVARGAAVLVRPLRASGVAIWAALFQCGLCALILGPMMWALCRALPGVDPTVVPSLGNSVIVVVLVWLCISVLRGQAGPMVGLVDLFAPYPHDRYVEPQERLLAQTDHTPSLSRPAFLARGDLALPGAVMRVSADNHYLVIQTTHGTGRMIMRFRDALRDLEGLQGFRIHRSHWVAMDAVLRVRAAGRRHVLELIDGSVLPVSQAYLEPLRANGLLDQRGMGKRMGGEASKIASASRAINPASSGRLQNIPPV